MAGHRSNDKIGRAGEHFVAGELNRRGAYASPFSGNVPGIDIVAADDKRERMAYIQVKTKGLGLNWQVSLAHGWAIPNSKPECLCIGTCEPGKCKSDHEHHSDAIDLLKAHPIPGKPDHYWVFVSLKDLAYWIVPDCTVRGQLIRESHIAYLKGKGGHRPGHRHDSLYFTITEKVLKPWEGKWDVLELGLDVV